ncbi:MAG: GDSL-type esterase/lipase family protein [Candidatus Magasanikbacteria bacterium]
MKKILFFLFLITIFIPKTSHAELGSSLTDYSQEQLSEIQQMAESPSLRITIPGLQFTDPQSVVEMTKEAGVPNRIVLPFLGEYIVVMYRYGIVSISIIAIIIIMISGLQYMLPGEGNKNITQAKERIERSLIAIVLAVGSYTLLYTINPALVRFQNLSITTVAGVSLNDLVYDDRDPVELMYAGDVPTSPGSKLMTDTSLDDTFRSFANCINVNWKVLKAIAYHESRLNSTISNSGGFVGLFQTKAIYCNSALNSLPDWQTYCTTEWLKNPYINTAVGTKMLQNGLNSITSNCGKQNATDTFILLYINHNCGSGALRSTMKAANCQVGDSMREALEAFWKSYKGGGPYRSYVAKRNAPMGYAKYDYSVKVAKTIVGLGVADIYDTSDNKTSELKCPYESSPAQYISGSGEALTLGSISCNESLVGKRVLVIGDSITAHANSYAQQLKISPTCSKLSYDIDAVGGKQTEWMKNEASGKDFSQVNYLIILGGVNDIASGKTVAQIKTNLETIYKKAKEKNTTVIAITVTPWYGQGSNTNEAQAKTEELNNWIRTKVPTQQGSLIDYVIDGYALLGSASDQKSLDPKYKGGDSLHFNAKGHEVLAKAIAQAVFN